MNGAAAHSGGGADLGRPAHGFTLVELLVVSVLMASVTLITAQMSQYFSEDMTSLAARARAVRELRFAVHGICDDLGATVGAIVVAEDRIRLCKDDGDDPNGQADWVPPDVMVEYYLSDGQLVRYEPASGSQIVIADSVSQFAVRNITDTVFEIIVAVARSDIERRVTLMWSKP